MNHSSGLQSDFARSPAPATTGERATMAVLMEITASKPGNVHRGADFDDVTFFDFAAGAVAIGPVFDRAGHGAGLGRLVYDGVVATRSAVGANTNLGTLLLLAPLALANAEKPLSSGVTRVLSALTPDDAQGVYAAILHAQPGGMGKVDEHDIAAPPPADLLMAMRAAAERDLVARQYANNFEQVLGFVVPRLTVGLERGWGLHDTIVRTHLELMATYPDSLIARKCGPQVAQDSATHAAATLAAGEPGDENYAEALADLDFWLRSDHHRRNPGTTADLIAAGLFAALRDGIIKSPYRWTRP